MKAIRKYLLDDTQLFNLLGSNNIFFVEKPDEIKCDEYIVYRYKPIQGGYVKRYQFDFQLIGKDINKLVKIEKRLIELLDDYKGKVVIKDEEMLVRQVELINGGGQVKDPDTGNFIIVLYFLFQI